MFSLFESSRWRISREVKCSSSVLSLENQGKVAHQWWEIFVIWVRAVADELRLRIKKTTPLRKLSDPNHWMVKFERWRASSEGGGRVLITVAFCGIIWGHRSSQISQHFGPKACHNLWHYKKDHTRNPRAETVFQRPAKSPLMSERAALRLGFVVMICRFEVRIAIWKWFQEIQRVLTFGAWFSELKSWFNPSCRLRGETWVCRKMWRLQKVLLGLHKKQLLLRIWSYKEVR